MFYPKIETNKRRIAHIIIHNNNLIKELISKKLIIIIIIFNITIKYDNLIKKLYIKIIWEKKI